MYSGVSELDWPLFILSTIDWDFLSYAKDCGFGHRQRFVAKVRDHYVSAVARCFTMWPCSDVSCKLGLFCTRVSTRAGWTHSIGTIAGSIQINEGRLSSLCVQFSYNNLPASWLYNRIFYGFYEQDLVCEVVSLLELCSRLSLVPPVRWVGGCPSLPRGKTYGLLAGGWSPKHPRPAQDDKRHLALFKIDYGAGFSVKSVPIKPAALVGSEHT